MSELETKKRPTYEFGSGVWVKLFNRIWWSGTVVDPLSLSQDLLDYVKTVEHISVVKFESKGKYEIVCKNDQILPYMCDRKMEFIEEGFKIYKHQKMGLPVVIQFDMDKFKKDVISMDHLIGGVVCIFEKFKGKNEKFWPVVGKCFFTLRKSPRRNKTRLL